MTLAEMLTELIFHSGRPDLCVVGGQGNRHINRATLDVILHVKPPEATATQTITVTAGDFTYSLDSTVFAILNVRSTFQEKRLVRGSQREFDDGDQSTQGRPAKWFRFGNEVFFYDHIPNADETTMLVRHLTRPALLSTGAATFPLSLEWEEPVILRAAWKMLVTLKNPAWQELKAAYGDAIGTILDHHKRIEDEHDKDAHLNAGAQKHARR